MKKILVPVDFTSYSENAVRMAGYFAGVKGMEVKLLHIIEKSGMIAKLLNNTEKKDYLPEYIQAAEGQLEKYASCYLPVDGNNSWEVRATGEDISDELLKETGYEVLIMGRKRIENRRVFSGSIAEKMVRLSPVPVITVGELESDFKIKNISFASDFSEDEIKPILQRVLDLALIFNADLHLVYVQLNRYFLTTQQTKEKVNGLLKKFDLEKFNINIYVADSEEEGITKYTEEYKTDLLVMVTHGRNGFSQFFNDSISENVSLYGKVPVLTYNMKKEKIDRAVKPITRTLFKRREKEAK